MTISSTGFLCHNSTRHKFGKVGVSNFHMRTGIEILFVISLGLWSSIGIGIRLEMIIVLYIFLRDGYGLITVGIVECNLNRLRYTHISFGLVNEGVR